MSSLYPHIKSIHGVKYNCNQCDFKSRNRRTLKRHALSAHNGVKYDCDQCDYRASKQQALTQHII